MEIEKVIPDVLDREETRIVTGVPRPRPDDEESHRVSADVFSADGLLVEPGESTITYGDQTRSEVFQELGEMSQPWVYIHGGWNNGLTIETNFCAGLKDVPFGQRTVKNVMLGMVGGGNPRIFYDYVAGWKDMLQQKGIEVEDAEFERMTVGHLLLEVGGAPTRWNCMVDLLGKEELLLPPTTSTPFPGAEYGNGFIVTQRDFLGKSICNTTGSRGFDSVALMSLLVFLRHDAVTAEDFYVKDAEHRAKGIRDKDKSPPFSTEDIAKYASAFVETLKPVKEDIFSILSGLNDEDVQGFQYAVSIMIDKLLGVAVYKVPSSRPYYFIKTDKGWIQP